MRRIRNKFRYFPLYSLVAVVTFLILFPAIFAVLTSFKPIREIFTYPPSIFPHSWTIKPYISIFTREKYLHYFFNGYFISICSTLLCLIFGGLAGYGFSRFKLPAKRLLLLGILAAQMFPGAILMVSYFNLSKNLGLYNTYLILIMVDTTFALPLVIWLLKSYFDSIPVTLEEAALIDGCSRLKVLLLVVAPLARAGVIGTGMLAFIRAWNEFLFALILTKGPERAPITVGLAELFGQYSINWNGIMAITTLAVLPLLIVFIFVQRYVISGITTGAVK
ncbi:MAG: carbohydrate ABC transporter permease [Candidatus Aerophobetes bacterium]|nr:carbohydrate ABC transporter permease [Candidatus Aerophobetes bacterium]